jgi:hypothetical protein
VASDASTEDVLEALVDIDEMISQLIPMFGTIMIPWMNGCKMNTRKWLA